MLSISILTLAIGCQGDIPPEDYHAIVAAKTMTHLQTILMLLHIWESLENRVSRRIIQWSCSLFSLKELSEGQTTVYYPWDGPAWA